MSSKQRDALLAVYDCAKDGVLAIRESAFEKVMEALAEPVRNCDVGTAEEQDKRFTHQFCRAGIEGCIRCKLNTLQHRGNTCGIHWSQMPYEKGEAE